MSTSDTYSTDGLNPPKTGAEAEPAPQEAPRKPRGPYRISDADLLKDPQALAFRDALRAVTDPEKRATLVWLLLELARAKDKGR